MSARERFDAVQTVARAASFAAVRGSSAMTRSPSTVALVPLANCDKSVPGAPPAARGETGKFVHSPTNVAFAGPELDVLVLAPLCGLWVKAIDPGVRGAPLHYPAVGFAPGASR